MKFFEGKQGEYNMWFLAGLLFLCGCVGVALFIGRDLGHRNDLVVVHTEEPQFEITEYEVAPVDWDSVEVTEVSLDDIPIQVETIEKPIVSDVVEETITEEVVISDTEEAVVTQTEEYEFNSEIALDPKLQDFTKQKCEEYSVSYPLILALMESESSFNKNIGNEKILGGEGDKRYYGYMQLSADNCERANANGINAHTPEGNIEWGIKLMSDYINKYGEVEAAISAYKCGEGATDSGKRVNCEKIINNTMKYSELLGVD